jgi:hypothetical protein
MLNRRKTNAISKAYGDLNSSSSAFSSVAQVYKKARNIEKTVTFKDVQQYLRGVNSYTLHRRSLKNFPRRRIISQGINFQWQVDLTVLSSRHTRLNKCKYILCAVDSFSRKLFCKELKKKTNAEIITRFASFIKSNGKPRNLLSDSGSEFLGGQFQAFLKKQGIRHFLARNAYHASIIERCQRTLKERIFRWMTHNNTEVFIPHLQKFVQAYNDSPHSSLPDGLSPSDITKENEDYVWKKQYSSIVRKAGAPSPNLKVGQTVRITRNPELFRKGYEARFSKEKFIISRVHPSVPPVYRIKRLNGADITGFFYQQQLQPVI